MKSRGFTLIEVLISVGMLGLIGALLMTSFNSSLDMRDRVEGQSDRYHEVSQAMGRMVREISMAYVSLNISPSYPVVETKFRGLRSELAFSAFGHVIYQENARESDQRELAYFIGKDDKTGKPALMRKERVNLGRKFGENGKTQVLCRDVTELKFEYWNDSRKSWDTEWRIETLPTQDHLPSRVRITFKAIMSEGNEKKFMTETEIWIVNPIQIT